MPSSRPNIILVYTDQQRYDTLGSSGNRLVRTPHLDAMAEEGVCFSRSYVTCPLCVPSRVSLWTGRYNHTNLSLTNARLLRDEEDDFASAFRRQGYATALIGKNHCYPAARMRGTFSPARDADHFGFEEPLTPTEQRNRDVRRNTMQAPLADDPRCADVVREHRDHLLQWEIETEDTRYRQEDKKPVPAGG